MINKKEKKVCSFCLDSGMVNELGGIPSDPLNGKGPWKGCPLCKLDKTPKVDDIILESVKGLHMKNFVWSLDIKRKAYINKEEVVRLSNYINSTIYYAKDPSSPATTLDPLNASKDYFRLLFHGSLHYTDITSLLKKLNIAVDNDIITVNRVNTKDYI